MEDGEVVAAIVAGDPRGIAEAYDRYAMPLYAYCRSLLREPEDAADAVQDTFLSICFDAKRQWRHARNIWHNSAVLSVLQTIAAPVTGLGRMLRRDKAESAT